MNKKYAALITIALIAHITNTAEQDKPTDLNSTWRGISTNPRKKPIVIEDNEETDYVKVIFRNIGKETQLVKKTGRHLDYHNFFVTDELYPFKDYCKIFYNKECQFLAACTFKDDDKKGVSYSLRSAINPDQRKIYYNEERQELTITIPRIIE